MKLVPIEKSGIFLRSVLFFLLFSYSLVCKSTNVVLSRGIEAGALSGPCRKWWFAES